MILQPTCWSYHVIISCSLKPPSSMRVLFTMFCKNVVLNIIPTLYEGFMVSVHIMVMESRPIDPGSIQGSHRRISFIREKHRTRANDFLWNLSTNNHIVGLVHKNHILNEIRNKRQLWVRPIEWLKLNFASCVVHQTRSRTRLFYISLECLRKYVFQNLLLQKLSRMQYLRYIF